MAYEYDMKINILKLLNLVYWFLTSLTYNSVVKANH
jgi:hypothetical protein